MFGTTTDERTSFALLDRFAEAGGTFVDTSNNYAFWANGGRGGESEALLGRWLKANDSEGRMVVATKVGAKPNTAGRSYHDDAEGLSAPVIRAAIQESLDRLGRDRVDVYYAHIEDRSTPLEETLGAFAGLVEDGTVGLLGVSNHPAWQVERARTLSAARGWPAYQLNQLSHSYFQPRYDVPVWAVGAYASPEHLDHLRSQPDLALVAYSPLLRGAYSRADKPLPETYRHAGNDARRAALEQVAKETGATVNQVVLAWMTGDDPAAIALVSASRIEQLDESLAAADLDLTPDQRARLDHAADLPDT
jgi:aryl-alcohol dehydrogenase-like predicted oxidoreductase